MYIDSREGVKGSLLQLECVWGCICIRQEPKNKQKDPFFHYVCTTTTQLPLPPFSGDAGV